jgi:predicted transposase/invertase (TIGR01784 family)
MGDRTIISFDYAIKHILRDKSSFNILGGFLTELLGRKVTVLEILESEGNKDDPTSKTNRVDLKAKIKNSKGGKSHEIAIFEIQFADMHDFFGKMLFNVSRAVVEQISKTDKYDVKKVYMISIAYFDLGAKKDYMFTAKVTGFKGVHTGENIPFAQNDCLQPNAPRTDIHPEYYLLLPQMFDERIKDGIDEWVYTLKTSEVKEGFKAAGLREAGEKLDELKMTPQERRAYEKFVRDQTDGDTIAETAVMKGLAEGLAKGLAKGLSKGLAKGRKEGIKIGHAEGLTEGIEKGKAEGLEKGKAEGLEKGKAEGKAEGEKEAARKIALSMKNAGYSVEDIVKMTGLTAAEIRAL